MSKRDRVSLCDVFEFISPIISYAIGIIWFFVLLLSRWSLSKAIGTVEYGNFIGTGGKEIVLFLVPSLASVLLVFFKIIGKRSVLPLLWLLPIIIVVILTFYFEKLLVELISVSAFTSIAYDIVTTIINVTISNYDWDLFDVSAGHIRKNDRNTYDISSRYDDPTGDEGPAIDEDGGDIDVSDM